MVTSRKYWKLVMAIIIILVVLISAFSTANNHKLDHRTQAAAIVQLLGWGAIGVFLAYSFIKDKDKEDSGAQPVIVSPNSPEDLEMLRVRRNNIIAWILLVFVLVSSYVYITNDYRAGWTPLNASAIFNVVIDVGTLYFIFKLFKINKNHDPKVIKAVVFLDYFKLCN